jgi:hypothetical protein
MTMTHFETLNDHATEALRGGYGCKPKVCYPKPYSYTHQTSYDYHKMIKLPPIYIPKIHISWGKYKTNPC